MNLLYAIYSVVLAGTIVGGTVPPTQLPTPVQEVRTLESEINRLSLKYEIASSTVYAIIKCESQLYGEAVHQNLDKNGNVWSTDIGYLQINDYYHRDTMRELGLDINNQWEALEYGFLLMKSQGYSPWKASEFCWRKEI